MLVSSHVLTNTQHLLECEATKYTLKYKSEVLHTKLHSSLAKISQSGINQEATVARVNVTDPTSCETKFL